MSDGFKSFSLVVIYTAETAVNATTERQAPPRLTPSMRAAATSRIIAPTRSRERRIDIAVKTMQAIIAVRAM